MCRVGRAFADKVRAASPAPSLGALVREAESVWFVFRFGIAWVAVPHVFQLLCLFRFHGAAHVSAWVGLQVVVARVLPLSPVVGTRSQILFSSFLVVGFLKKGLKKKKKKNVVVFSFFLVIVSGFKKRKEKEKEGEKIFGSTQIRTVIKGSRVLYTSHYTIEPFTFYFLSKLYIILFVNI